MLQTTTQTPSLALLCLFSCLSFTHTFLPSFQDMDRYEKGPSLIGEGPTAPQPALPIIPPSVG